MRWIAASTLLLAATALPLSAQTTWTSTSATATGDPGVGPGETIVVDFEAPVAGVAYSGSFTIGSGLVSGRRAPPFGVTNNYFATPNVDGSSSGTATIDFSSYIASRGSGAPLTVSFYWGSIDRYNTLEVLGSGGTLLSLTGTQVNDPANGNQFAAATNQRVFLSFAGPDEFTGLRLTSNGRAFEIDDIAMSFAGGSTVPEPSTWALLMLAGGMLGRAALRRRRIARTIG